jgi:capsular polysaccharide biosynthesis protein
MRNSIVTPAHEEAAVLRPASVSKRRLPVNFRPDDAGLFGHEFERVIPPSRLLELRGVRVSDDGILFNGMRMRPESFAYPHNREGWKRRSVLKFFASNYLLRRRRRFGGEAIWVVDDWSGAYFHWLTDVLSRLYTVRERARRSVLLLPHRFKGLQYVGPSLSPFAVRRVEYINPGEVLICDKLVVPTHTAPSGHYNEEVISGVRELLVDYYGGARGEAAGGRVYISRSKAPKRRVVNEEEVIGVLREFDFEIVHAEDCSFEQQVRVAAGARYLVSNHGAGLTNMLFMPPGASVLELRHREDRVNNCYFTLASALDLNYLYQTCESENPGEDPHTANLTVDPESLRENVKLLLSA